MKKSGRMGCEKKKKEGKKMKFIFGGGKCVCVRLKCVMMTPSFSPRKLIWWQVINDTP